MRAALIIDWTRLTVEENLTMMSAWTARAAEAGDDLVLFPEAALTGLINNDDPAHDLPLGRPIPGRETDCLCEMARRHRVYLGAGLLERDGECLYDSAVLASPDGDLILTYRRIQPQWHSRKADPEVYRQGSELPVAVTSFGTMAILLCGDIFDDDITARVRSLAPDYLLFPFARCFRDGSFDQARWDREEEGEYADRARRCGCTTLMVNQLDDPRYCDYPGFGGAMVVAKGGEILARWPLGQPGMLLWNDG